MENKEEAVQSQRDTARRAFGWALAIVLGSLMLAPQAAQAHGRRNRSRSRESFRVSSRRGGFSLEYRSGRSRRRSRRGYRGSRSEGFGLSYDRYGGGGGYYYNSRSSYRRSYGRGGYCR